MGQVHADHQSHEQMEPSLFPIQTIRPSIMGHVARALVPLTIAFILIGVLSDYDAGSSEVTYGNHLLKPGTVLATLDTEQPGKRHTLRFPRDTKETSLLIWDYAAEDGDWVQLFFEGEPLGPPFMIENAPKTFRVPVGGTFEVLGVRDGGGGITYAVHFPDLRMSVRNGTGAEQRNTYHLLHRDGEP